MDVGDLIFSFLPLIMFAVLLLFLLRKSRNLTVTVHMIAAVKPDFPDKIEMRVSTDKSEINQWEKTFWSGGYRVSLRTDDLKVKLGNKTGRESPFRF